MNVREFKNRLSLIMSFTGKMNEELIPCNFQRIIIKVYASMLKINLTDKMINDIV